MRESNVELLRIIAIFGILIAHCVGYATDVVSMFSSPSKATLFLSCASTLGKIGVHVFFLITGYFLYKREFNSKRITKTLKTTWIYSSLFGIIAIIASGNLTARNILTSIFPVTTGMYWFIVTYLVIILLAPISNMAIKYINRTNKWKLFFSFVAIFYGLNLIGKFIGISFDVIEPYRILTYVLTYICGGWIAMHGSSIKRNKRIALLLAAGIALFISRVIKVYALQQTGYDLWVADDRDVFIFCAAVSLFLCFDAFSIKNKAINQIAQSVFAAYLITEQSLFRPFVWQTFNLSVFFGSKALYLFTIIYPAAVLTACLLADQIARTLIKKAFLLRLKRRNYS